MKDRLILQQHMPYSTMINEALAFCEFMLAHSPTLYPFALMSADNALHCIFLPASDQHAKPQMIESLQSQIESSRNPNTQTSALLVYSAILRDSEEDDTDALVFTITDSQGHNTITIYPYEHQQDGIRLKPPYTCDFSD